MTTINRERTFSWDNPLDGAKQAMLVPEAQLIDNNNTVYAHGVSTCLIMKH